MARHGQQGTGLDEGDRGRDRHRRADGAAVKPAGDAVLLDGAAVVRVSRVSGQDERERRKQRESRQRPRP
jgi:hypothetical protein